MLKHRTIEEFIEYPYEGDVSDRRKAEFFDGDDLPFRISIFRHRADTDENEHFVMPLTRTDAEFMANALRDLLDAQA